MVVVKFVSLPRFASDIGFVSFDNTTKDKPILAVHRAAYPSLHIPRGFVVYSPITPQLMTGYAFLGVKHQDNSQEPCSQRHFGILEQCTVRDSETGITIMAIPATNTLLLSFPSYMRTPAERTVHPVLVPMSSLYLRIAKKCAYIGISGFE